MIHIRMVTLQSQVRGCSANTQVQPRFLRVFPRRNSSEVSTKTTVRAFPGDRDIELSKKRIFLPHDANCDAKWPELPQSYMARNGPDQFRPHHLPSEVAL